MRQVFFLVFSYFGMRDWPFRVRGDGGGDRLEKHCTKGKEILSIGLRTATSCATSEFKKVFFFSNFAEFDVVSLFVALC